MAGLREPLGQYSSSGEIVIGPFMDETDGITPLTGLSIANADIRLSINNANFVQKNSATTTVEDADGMYKVHLDSTDLNASGHMIVAIHTAGALPVWRKYQVNSDM